MSEYLIQKVKQLKTEGYDYSKIRKYLENSGTSHEEISMIFRRVDNEEIHELYQKQQLRKNRAELIASIVLVLAGIVFNIYRFGKDEAVDLFTLLIPIAIFFPLYLRYQRIKNKNYSTSEILKENRKYKEST